MKFNNVVAIFSLADNNNYALEENRHIITSAKDIVTRYCFNDEWRYKTIIIPENIQILVHSFGLDYANKSYILSEFCNRKIYVRPKDCNFYKAVDNFEE